MILNYKVWIFIIFIYSVVLSQQDSRSYLRGDLIYAFREKLLSNPNIKLDLFNIGDDESNDNPNDTESSAGIKIMGPMTIEKPSILFLPNNKIPQNFSFYVKFKPKFDKVNNSYKPGYLLTILDPDSETIRLAVQFKVISVGYTQFIEMWIYLNDHINRKGQSNPAIKVTLPNVQALKSRDIIIFSFKIEGEIVTLWNGCPQKQTYLLTQRISRSIYENDMSPGTALYLFSGGPILKDTFNGKVFSIRFFTTASELNEYCTTNEIQGSGDKRKIVPNFPKDFGNVLITASSVKTTLISTTLKLKPTPVSTLESSTTLKTTLTTLKPPKTSRTLKSTTLEPSIITATTSMPTTLVPISNTTSTSKTVKPSKTSVQNLKSTTSESTSKLTTTSTNLKPIITSKTLNLSKTTIISSKPNTSSKVPTTILRNSTINENPLGKGTSTMKTTEDPPTDTKEPSTRTKYPDDESTISESQLNKKKKSDDINLQLPDVNFSPSFTSGTTPHRNTNKPLIAPFLNTIENGSHSFTEAIKSRKTTNNGKRDLLAEFLLDDAQNSGLVVQLFDDDNITVQVTKPVMLVQPSVLYFPNNKFPNEFGFVIVFNPKNKDGYILSLVDPDGKTVRLGIRIQTQPELMDGGKLNILNLLLYLNDDLNIMGEEIPIATVLLPIDDRRRIFHVYIFISSSQITIWSGCPYDHNQISSVPIKRINEINIRSGSAFYLFSAGNILNKHFKGFVSQLKMFYSFDSMMSGCEKKVEGSGLSTSTSSTKVTEDPTDIDEEDITEESVSSFTPSTFIPESTKVKDIFEFFDLLQFFVISNLENLPKSIKQNVNQPDTEETYIEITEAVTIQDTAMLIYPNLKFPDDIGIIIDFVPKEGFLFSIVDPDLTTIRLGISVSKIKATINDEIIELKQLNVYFQDKPVSSSRENNILVSFPLTKKSPEIKVKSEFMKLSILISQRKITIWSECLADENILHEQIIERSSGEFNMNPGSLIYLFSSGPIVKYHYKGSIKSLKLFNSRQKLLSECLFDQESTIITRLSTKPESKFSTMKSLVETPSIDKKMSTKSPFTTLTRRPIKSNETLTKKSVFIPFSSTKGSMKTSIQSSTESSKESNERSSTASSQSFEFSTFDPNKINVENPEVNPDLLQFLILDSETKPDGIKVSLGQLDSDATIISVISPVNIQVPAQLYFPNSKLQPNIGIVMEFIPNEGFLFSVVDPDLKKIHLGVSISEDREIINDGIVKIKKINVFLQDGSHQSSIVSEPLASVNLPETGRTNNKEGFTRLIVLISKNEMKIWRNSPTDENVLYIQSLKRNLKRILRPGSSLFLFSAGSQIKQFYKGLVKKLKLYTSKIYLQPEFQIEGSGMQSAIPIIDEEMETQEASSSKDRSWKRKSSISKSPKISLYTSPSKSTYTNTTSSTMTYTNKSTISGSSSTRSTQKEKLSKKIDVYKISSLHPKQKIVTSSKSQTTPISDHVSKGQQFRERSIGKKSTPISFSFVGRKSTITVSGQSRKDEEPDKYNPDLTDQSDINDFLSEYYAPNKQSQDGILSTIFSPDSEEIKVTVYKDVNVTKPSMIYFPNNKFPEELGFTIDFNPSLGKEESFLFAFVDPNLKTLRLALQTAWKVHETNGVETKILQVKIYFNDKYNQSPLSQKPIGNEDLFVYPLTSKSVFRLSFLITRNHLQFWNGCPLPLNKLQTIPMYRNFDFMNFQEGGVLYLFSGGPILKGYYQGDVLNLKMSRSKEELLSNCRSDEIEGSGKPTIPIIRGNVLITTNQTTITTETTNQITNETKKFTSPIDESSKKKSSYLQNISRSISTTEKIKESLKPIFVASTVDTMLSNETKLRSLKMTSLNPELNGSTISKVKSKLGPSLSPEKLPDTLKSMKVTSTGPGVKQSLFMGSSIKGDLSTVKATSMLSFIDKRGLSSIISTISSGEKSKEFSIMSSTIKQHPELRSVSLVDTSKTTDNIVESSTLSSSAPSTIKSVPSTLTITFEGQTANKSSKVISKTDSGLSTVKATSLKKLKEDKRTTSSDQFTSSVKDKNLSSDFSTSMSRKIIQVDKTFGSPLSSEKPTKLKEIYQISSTLSTAKKEEPVTLSSLYVSKTTKLTPLKVIALNHTVSSVPNVTKVVSVTFESRTTSMSPIKTPVSTIKSNEEITILPKYPFLSSNNDTKLFSDFPLYTSKERMSLERDTKENLTSESFISSSPKVPVRNESRSISFSREVRPLEDNGTTTLSIEKIKKSSIPYSSTEDLVIKPQLSSVSEFSQTQSQKTLRVSRPVEMDNTISTRPIISTIKTIEESSTISTAVADKTEIASDKSRIPKTSMIYSDTTSGTYPSTPIVSKKSRKLTKSTKVEESLISTSVAAVDTTKVGPEKVTTLKPEFISPLISSIVHGSPSVEKEIKYTSSTEEPLSTFGSIMTSSSTDSISSQQQERVATFELHGTSKTQSPLTESPEKVASTNTETSSTLRSSTLEDDILKFASSSKSLISQKHIKAISGVATTSSLAKESLRTSSAKPLILSSQEITDKSSTLRLSTSQNVSDFPTRISSEITDLSKPKTITKYSMVIPSSSSAESKLIKKLSTLVQSSTVLSSESTGKTLSSSSRSKEDTTVLKPTNVIDIIPDLGNKSKFIEGNITTSKLIISTSKKPEVLSTFITEKIITPDKFGTIPSESRSKVTSTMTLAKKSKISTTIPKGTSTILTNNQESTQTMTIRTTPSDKNDLSSTLPDSENFDDNFLRKLYNQKLVKGSKGERGEKGNVGGPGVKGETGKNGEAGFCSASICKMRKGEKGDQGISGQCSPSLCLSVKAEKGERGEMGSKGETGPKGESAMTSSKNKEMIESLIRRMVSEYLTSPDVHNLFRGEKGDTGSPGNCNCDANQEIGQEVRLLSNRLGKTDLIPERTVNHGYGAIVLKSKDELDMLGHFLSPGSLVLVTNQERGSGVKREPTLYVKLSDNPNKWRQLMAIFGYEQYLPVSNNHKRIAIPTPNPEHLLNSEKKLYFILLPEPWRGNIHITEANRICQRYASKNNYGGTFQAFLEDQSRSLKSLLASKYWYTWPIVNRNNETIFISWNQIFNGYSRRLGVPLLTFEGHDVLDLEPWRSKFMWVGGAIDIYTETVPSCGDWTSSSPTDFGMTVNLETPLFLNKLIRRPCGNSYYIGCIQVSPSEIKDNI